MLHPIFSDLRGAAPEAAEQASSFSGLGHLKGYYSKVRSVERVWGVGLLNTK